MNTHRNSTNSTMKEAIILQKTVTTIRTKIPTLLARKGATIRRGNTTIGVRVILTIIQIAATVTQILRSPTREAVLIITREGKAAAPKFLAPRTISALHLKTPQRSLPRSEKRRNQNHGQQRIRQIILQISAFKIKFGLPRSV